MAFYVNTLNTYYALCITSWENKRGNFYSVMLCFQGDRKCHEKKKKMSFSRCVKISHDVAH